MPATNPRPTRRGARLTAWAVDAALAQRATFEPAGASAAAVELPSGGIAASRPTLDRGIRARHTSTDLDALAPALEDRFQSI